MSSPESIKSGMAKSAKLSNPVPIRCATVVDAGSTGILTNNVNKDDIAILHATGVPIVNRHIKLITKTSIGAYSIAAYFFKISEIL
jgi:hypothetical protein